jgi:hypothetical protein
MDRAIEIRTLYDRIAKEKSPDNLFFGNLGGGIRSGLNLMPLASVQNARLSVQEPGVARFDVLQQADDAAAPGRHKKTSHHAAWRDAVAEPQSSIKYANVFPANGGW